ncbi:MAG: hypothetical protein KatS3mg023_3890 [Armatimonadota bacterium]|nr:MAG: hypothetical protein KatS3mg023_3890 [Armatimonadota bacterium]
MPFCFCAGDGSSGEQNGLLAIFVWGRKMGVEKEWIHKLMVAIAVGVLLFSLVLHHFAPEDQLYVLVATTALGFLFGKATNGLSKKSEEDVE